MPIEAAAIRTEQRDLTLYLTSLTANQLADRFAIDYWTEDNPDRGYQRPLMKSRLRALREFLLEYSGTIPTALILCARKGSSAPIFKPVGKLANGAATAGTLSLGDRAKLWLVDGQTRLLGTLDAIAEGHEELRDFPFVCVIMAGLSEHEEMTQFNTINSMAHKVPTDISDQLLRQMHQTGDVLSEREVLKARATIIAEGLNAKRSVWKGQIKIPNVKGREHGRAKLHAFVTSLQPVLTDSYVRLLDEPDVAVLVRDYWDALRETFPEAFAEPEAHTVQASPGLQCLHMILPDVLQLALSRTGRRRLPGRKEMALVLRPLRKFGRAYKSRHGASFWAKEGGHDLAIALGFGAHRRLANVLRRNLPKLPARALEEEREEAVA